MATQREKVRLYEDGERWWGEEIGNGIYRSLNTTFSSATLKLTPEADANLPEGHPTSVRNGEKVRIHWGHLLECRVTSGGDLIPLFIIGYDGTPCEETGLV